MLVTGATGFVGSHVAKLLSERGYRVRALVRRSSRIDNLTGINCEPFYGDLRDADAVAQATAGCEWVFHVAADYRLWSRHPRDLYRTNVEGTVHVLRAAAASGVARVIYTSTVGALGIPGDGTPGNEETPTSLADMVGHYKRSKYLAEEEVHRFVEREGLDVVIVNPSTPVGEGDIRPTPTGRIIVDFLNRRMPAYVQTGLNVVDVRDVAAGHLLAAERGAPGRRYILGNANLTLKGLFDELASITDLPAPERAIPHGLAMAFAVCDTFITGALMGREPRASVEAVRMSARRMHFDSSRAVAELGLPQSPVREALTRAVEWFWAHGYVKQRPIRTTQ